MPELSRVFHSGAQPREPTVPFGRLSVQSRRITLIEVLIEIVLSALWEALFQVVAEVLIEGGWRLFGEPLVQRARAQPVVAAVALVILGGLMAFVFSLVVPGRIIPAGPLPGASLLVTPIAVGAIMARYGRWLKGRGYVPSYVASFWGGAFLAVGMTTARFLLVRR